MEKTDNTAITAITSSIFRLWLHTESVHERTHLEHTLGNVILGFSLKFCVRAHYYSKWLELVSAGLKKNPSLTDCSLIQMGNASNGLKTKRNVPEEACE